MNSSDDTVIRNLINSENAVMCQLYIGKYHNIKEFQVVKHMYKIINCFKGLIS